MVIVERVPGSAFPQVMRVHVRSEDPDLDEPWSSTSYVDVGVAVVIGPRWLLTLASTVTDAVPWERPLGPDQAVATVLAVDHDRDLALLEVAGSITETWGIEPLELGELPAVGDVVLLAGFTEDAPEQRSGHAVIAAIELTRYIQSQRHLLAATIDARQPFSDSSDVALRAGKLIGIVMQRATDDPQRGDIIAPAIIQAFLDGVRAGKPPGVPDLGLTSQLVENARMRTRFGLGPDDGGVLVTRVDHGGTCDGVLRPRDLLVAIDGVPIARDGTVVHAGRTLRHYAVLSGRHIGDRVRLEIRRDGAPATLDVTLGPQRALVPRVRPGTPPRYLVFAGLVLQPVTRDYLRTWDTWWHNSPKEFLAAYYGGVRTPERLEVVALTSLLADPINAGYASFHNEEILAVNGRPPRDLHGLAAALDSATGTIELATSLGGLIVLDAAEARAATARILEAHGIERDRQLG